MDDDNSDNITQENLHFSTDRSEKLEHFIKKIQIRPKVKGAELFTPVFQIPNHKNHNTLNINFLWWQG